MMKAKILTDYIYKIAKKKKIVFVKELLRDKNTPRDIIHILLDGSVSGKLQKLYAYKKGLYCRNTLLGSIKQRSVIAYLKEHEPYIEKLEKKHSSLLKKRVSALKRVELIEKQIGDLLRRS